jgi:hypothetical protein
MSGAPLSFLSKPQRQEIFMIIAHYAHRLPADHDIAAIRKRAMVRGQLWDAVPKLGFKGSSCASAYVAVR